MECICRAGVFYLWCGRMFCPDGEPLELVAFLFCYMNIEMCVYICV